MPRPTISDADAKPGLAKIPGAPPGVRAGRTLGFGANDKRGTTAEVPGDQTRKVLMLVGCVAVLGFLVYRQLGPASVDASALPPTMLTGETIKTNGGDVRIPPIARSAHLVKQWRGQPIPQVSRNLFHSEWLNPTIKATIEEIAPPPEPVRQGDGGLFWQELERSLAARADRVGQRKAMLDEVLFDANALTIRTPHQRRSSAGDGLRTAGHAGENARADRAGCRQQTSAFLRRVDRQRRIDSASRRDSCSALGKRKATGRPGVRRIVLA